MEVYVLETKMWIAGNKQIVFELFESKERAKEILKERVNNYIMKLAHTNIDILVNTDTHFECYDLYSGNSNRIYIYEKEVQE